MKISRSAVLWNLVGLVIPLLIAFASIPALLHRLGKERFGLLSLAWSLTAVAGLFDLGVGRAATLVISRRLGIGDTEGATLAARASTRLALYSGAGGAAIFAASLLLGALQLLAVTPTIESEVYSAAWILLPAIPLQVGIAAYRGICEANQLFHRISVIRILMGIANFGGPWLVSMFSPDLRVLIASLVAARSCAWLLHRSAAFPATEAHAPAARVPRTVLAELLRAGGWFTVSSVVSPILVQADRFLISSRLSPEVLPAYGVPAELVLQLLVMATATSTVLFPNLALLVASDPDAAWQALRRTALVISVQMAAIGLATAALLPTLLPWWIGAVLPGESVTVGQILCLGIWFNSLGMMFMAFVHSHRWFRATALAHVAELVLYLPALYLLLNLFGVVGAAIAWTARVALDTTILLCLAIMASRTMSTSSTLRSIPDDRQPSRH